jgi:drug/metabolite transporter (DMT)-like permease
VVGAAVLVICLWGSVYSALRVALQAIPAGPLAFLRLAIATLVLGLYGLTRGARIPDRSHWPRIAAIGFVGFAAYLVLLNIGQRTVNAGTASFIINTGPAMSALLAVLFLKERLTPAGAFGIVLSLLGIALLISSSGRGWQLEFSAGGLLLLMAAMAQATHFVLQKSALRLLSAYEVTLWSMCVATIVLGPFAMDAATALMHAPKHVTAAVIYLGIFPSAVAHLSWTFVLAHMPASKATSLLMLVSPMAVLIGGLWLGESLSTLAWVGGALALLGVALVQRAGRTRVSGSVAREAGE